MKKWIAATPCLALVFLLVSCGNPKSGDCPATIMANGTNYYSTGNAVPVEVDESAIQYTTSYAEDGVPKKDGEANFNRDTGNPYAVLEGGMVVVLIDNECEEQCADSIAVKYSNLLYQNKRVARCWLACNGNPFEIVYPITNMRGKM